MLTFITTALHKVTGCSGRSSRHLILLIILNWWWWPSTGISLPLFLQSNSIDDLQLQLWLFAHGIGWSNDTNRKKLLYLDAVRSLYKCRIIEDCTDNDALKCQYLTQTICWSTNKLTNIPTLSIFTTLFLVFQETYCVD